MPKLQLPSSSAIVEVSVINTAWASHIPCTDLFKPRIDGLDTIDICSYAFLITKNQKNGPRHLLFDLGIRKDIHNLVPDMVTNLKKWGTTVKAEKHVAEILQDHAFDIASLEAIIWSHWHWDHIGSPSTLPPTADLIVGPGIKDKLFPGWPTVSDAGFKEEDIANRKVIGLEHKSFDLDIGGFRAYDYFGDGSFYILDAPGHCSGHLNAFARTSSNPETFIFLAADSLHLGGEIRPSELLPLPDPVEVPQLSKTPVPAQEFLHFHPYHSSTKPFLGLDPCFPEDLEAAERTIELIQHFDAEDNVFVICSHDTTLQDTINFYPASANDWYQKDWKKSTLWSFLFDMKKVAK